MDLTSSLIKAKARELAHTFAGQWLEIRTPSPCR